MIGFGEKKKEATLQETTVSVFDNEDGLRLLEVFMAEAGITSWKHAPTEEARIRKDELQRFVHSILKNLAMTPDQIREAAIARQENRYSKPNNYE